MNAIHALVSTGPCKDIQPVARLSRNLELIFVHWTRSDVILVTLSNVGTRYRSLITHYVTSRELAASKPDGVN
jgi:hypothetical protein